MLLFDRFANGIHRRAVGKLQVAAQPVGHRLPDDRAAKLILLFGKYILFERVEILDRSPVLKPSRRIDRGAGVSVEGFAEAGAGAGEDLGQGGLEEVELGREVSIERALTDARPLAKVWKLSPYPEGPHSLTVSLLQSCTCCTMLD